MRTPLLALFWTLSLLAFGPATQAGGVPPVPPGAGVVNLLACPSQCGDDGQLSIGYTAVANSVLPASWFVHAEGTATFPDGHTEPIGRDSYVFATDLTIGLPGVRDSFRGPWTACTLTATLNWWNGAAWQPVFVNSANCLNV